jgi:hypothetical protein
MEKKPLNLDDERVKKKNLPTKIYVVNKPFTWRKKMGKRFGMR